MMHASIHPCKHAAVMKKIVGAMLSSAEASAAEELEASDAAADTLTGSSASESKGGISVDSYVCRGGVARTCALFNRSAVVKFGAQTLHASRCIF